MGRGPKGQKRRLKPFVAMDKGMLRSDVFKDLSSSAKVAYMYLRLDENGDPEKPLRLPYSQAKELMDRKTFTHALAELQEKGFIIRTKLGGLMGGCSEYALTNEWRTFKPPNEARGKKCKGENPPWPREEIHPGSY